MNVSYALEEDGSDSSSPDSKSSIASQNRQLPVISGPTGIRTASPNGSQNWREQEVVVVLSMDYDRESQLEDAEALWQVGFYELPAVITVYLTGVF